MKWMSANRKIWGPDVFGSDSDAVEDMVIEEECWRPGNGTAEVDSHGVKLRVVSGAGSGVVRKDAGGETDLVSLRLSRICLIHGFY